MRWWLSSRQGAALRRKGVSFEARVANTFSRLGKWNVRKNILLRDANNNLSEIDVRFGLFWKRYVECKNHSQPIPLDMVAKFKEVLLLNGISPSRGIFVASGTFTPRALTIGIKTYDGAQFRKLERWSYLSYALRRTVLLAAATWLGYTAYQRRAELSHRWQSRHKEWQLWRRWWREGGPRRSVENQRKQMQHKYKQLKRKLGL
ncbi:hypothetical protein QOT17_008121 [Balamuthia mandrillaris]